MAKMKKEVRSYEAALAYLGGKDQKKIGLNTYLIRPAMMEHDYIAVRLHVTSIIIYHRSGLVHVNSGGWLTSTTKSRINDFLPDPFRVSQTAFEWTLYNYKTQETWEFKDGMEVPSE